MPARWCQSRTLGVANARLIAVGGADPAVALDDRGKRPNRTDADSMPPLQPRVVDAAGVALLASWVNSLDQLQLKGAGCPAPRNHFFLIVIR